MNLSKHFSRVVTTALMAVAALCVGCETEGEDAESVTPDTDPTTHTVSFMDEDGETPLFDALTVTDGEKATEPTEDPTKEHHIFEAWYTDLTLETEYDFGTAVTSDITLYAKWSVAEYTVTFMNGDETYKTEDVEYGKTIDQPADPTGEDGDFIGWYTDEEFTTPWSFTTDVVEGVMTLYAKWDLVIATVTFKNEGETYGDLQKISESDPYATAPTTNPTKTGYTFKGWATTEVSTTYYVFTTEVTADLTLYAQYEIDTYTVSFDSDVTSQYIEYNSYALKPTSDPEKTGYTFQYWSLDGTTEYDFTTTAVTKDIALTAVWVAEKYDVKFVDDDGTTELSTTLNLEYGSLVTEPTEEPTETGYTFLGWYTKSGEDYTAWDFDTDTVPVDGVTLYAQWWDQSQPYPIASLSDLETFRDMVNGGSTTANATLTESFALPTNSWTPIGSSEYPYAGTFDGGSQTLSGLTISSTEAASVGLFGYLVDGASVKDLTLTGVAISSTGAGDYIMGVGGIAGSIAITATSVSISNCEVSGTIATTGGIAAGGVVGCVTSDVADGATIEDCTNNATVTVTTANSVLTAVGGIVGNTTNTIIKNSTNKGAIAGTGTGTNNNVATVCSPTGGIVGSATSSTISDCTNDSAAVIQTLGMGSNTVYVQGTGGIAGTINTGTTVEDCINNAEITTSGTNVRFNGGVVGLANGTDGAPTIKNCKNTAWVTGSSHYCGGIVAGVYFDATIENCHNSGAIGKESAYTSYGGIVGVIVAGSRADIIGCSNSGTVTLASSNQTFYAGGILGNGSSANVAYSEGVNNTNIIACYNTGTISNTGSTATPFGGIVGVLANGSIIGCYNTGSVEGPSSTYIGAIAGAINGFNTSTGSITTYGTVTLTDNYFVKDASDSVVYGVGTTAFTTVATEETEGATSAESITELNSTSVTIMNDAITTATYSSYTYSIVAGETLPTTDGYITPVSSDVE